MQYSAYVYPWDLVNTGVDATIKELVDSGYNGIDLASNYHAISSLSPRQGSHRMLYTELGAVFFPTRADRYGRIRPHLWHDENVMRAWPTAVEAARDSGITVHAWTIGVFQGWIAHRYPDCARVLPTGDRIPASVCPASPDVQEFLGALAADLVEQYDVDLVELEGVMYMGATTGWVRQRILTPVSPWASFLMSLCFCSNCSAVATSRGVDVEGVRARVVAALDTELASPAADSTPAAERRAEMEAMDEQFAEFLAIRSRNVTDLVRTIAARIATVSSTPRLSVWSPLEGYGYEGVDLESIIDVIGGLQVMSPRKYPQQAKIARSKVDEHGRAIPLTHIQPHPHDDNWGASSPEFAEEVRAAAALPVDRIAFYHLGLRTAEEMRAMVHVAEEVAS